jgi:hypothetical protein
MPLIQFRFSCGTCLVYALNGTKTAEVWASLLHQMQCTYLLRSDVNHRHGFASRSEILNAALRLKKCAAYLGYPLETISSQNWQGVLNTLHINFPEFFKQQVREALNKSRTSKNIFVSH